MKLILKRNLKIGFSGSGAVLRLVLQSKAYCSVNRVFFESVCHLLEARFLSSVFPSLLPSQLFF
jgi:hypothetical protein